MTTFHLFFMFKWWKLRLFLKWPINIKWKLKAQENKSELRFLSLIFVCSWNLSIMWCNGTCRGWYWRELVTGESERRDIFTIIFWIGRICIRQNACICEFPAWILKASNSMSTATQLLCWCALTSVRGFKYGQYSSERLVGIHNRLVTKPDVF